MVRPLVIVAVGALSLSFLPAGGQLEFTDAAGTLRVRAVASDVVRIDYTPAGATADPTEVIDPASKLRSESVGTVSGSTLSTSLLRVSSSPAEIRIRAASGITLAIDRAAAARGVIKLTHAVAEHIYGLRGSSLQDSRDPRLARANGLARDSGAPVAAGAQGDGGAPLAYSTSWGVLVDSVDLDATNAAGVLELSRNSRKAIEAYVTLGPPKRTISVAADLTGHPQMPPRWALGFMNSQWGTDEQEVRRIIATYREKQIPIDAFILDFDFKAWGEDDFGEFRWNSTSGAGNVAPNKFPNGESGGFAKDLAAQGVRLVGIMKPRVLVENTEHQPTKVAAEASPRGWWMPGKKPYNEYFSKRLANDFDFSKPDVRAFYWTHARHLFETGIVGWWNDEADEGFDSLGHLHMQQALYEGQRSVSEQRVFSLNRNFYLGAQRFAFATWSGDINTGFPVMAAERLRMLTSIDLGQAHWSMDAGGFNGHPSPENYARWMEFAAVVPIMRVHNTRGEHRQPWVYGPVAEAAAKQAIELRYRLLPTLYSWEREANRTGIGIVRPMFWEFPTDTSSANIFDEWMLGGSLLAAPVVDQGQTRKSIYLPPGRWFNFRTDAAIEGGRTIEVDTDATTWTDLPLFVRGGSILATQPVQQFANQAPVTELVLDVWPDRARGTRFDVYDDDGETYRYEQGQWRSQDVTSRQTNNGATVDFGRPAGWYPSTIKTYRVRVHGDFISAEWNARTMTSQKGSHVIEVVVPAWQNATLTVKR